MKGSSLGRIILFAFVALGLLSVMGVITFFYELLETKHTIHIIGIACCSLSTFAFYKLFDHFEDKL